MDSTHPNHPPHGPNDGPVQQRTFLLPPGGQDCFPQSSGSVHPNPQLRASPKNNTPLGKVPLRGPWKSASDLEDYGVEKTVKPSSLGVKTVRVFPKNIAACLRSSNSFCAVPIGSLFPWIPPTVGPVDRCSDLPMCRLTGIRWSQWMSITGLLADTYWWF